MRIERVSAQIAKAPADAKLYLTRGELRASHNDWKGAAADFDRAARLDSNLHDVWLARGDMYLQSGDAKKAKESLSRFLAKKADHGGALILRARAHRKLKQFDNSIQDYTKAIAGAADSRPEYFIERAEAQLAKDPKSFQKALDGIEEGISKVGPIAVLLLSAIDLEVKLNKFDSALRHLEMVSSQSQRQEKWLTMRGKILKQAGKNKEAKKAFQAARDEIESLPAHLRIQKEVKDLVTQIEKENLETD